MSNDLNQCNFIGRLGKDPEVRYSSSGNAVASFSIACGWKSKDKEGTEWVNITAFGKLAEIIQQYLKKGDQVYISGRFTTDTYEKDGQKRYSTKIIADKMQMLGGKRDDSAPRQQAKPANEPMAGGPVDDGYTDPIPFAPVDWRAS